MMDEKPYPACVILTPDDLADTERHTDGTVPLPARVDHLAIGELENIDIPTRTLATKVSRPSSVKACQTYEEACLGETPSHHAHVVDTDSLALLRVACRIPVDAANRNRHL